MRILAIDVGTGTQDILFYDSDGPIENSPKLVMPSPTATAARHIREATARGAAVVLTGVNSGGGPSHWALNDHLKSGAPAYATPSPPAPSTTTSPASKRTASSSSPKTKRRASTANTSACAMSTSWPYVLPWSPSAPTTPSTVSP